MSIEVAFREFALAVIVSCNCTDQVAWMLWNSTSVMRISHFHYLN